METSRAGYLPVVHGKGEIEMSQSSNAKKARRAINKHADKIEQNVALDIIEGLYRMPFWKRIKWALKIARGIPKGKKNAKKSN